MKLTVSEDWLRRMAKLEEDCDVTVGSDRPSSVYCCLTRPEVEALLVQLKTHAPGYDAAAQAFTAVVRRLTDWLETTR